MKYVSADTDNDVLPDLIEINAYIWAYNNPDDAPTDKSLWINPLVYDAYNDSDGQNIYIGNQTYFTMKTKGLEISSLRS